MCGGSIGQPFCVILNRRSLIWPGLRACWGEFMLALPYLIGVHASAIVELCQLAYVFDCFCLSNLCLVPEIKNGTLFIHPQDFAVECTIWIVEDNHKKLRSCLLCIYMIIATLLRFTNVICI